MMPPVRGRRGPNGSDVRSDIQSTNGLPLDDSCYAFDVPCKPPIEDHNVSNFDFFEEQPIRPSPNEQINQPKYSYPEIIPEDIPIKKSPLYLSPNAAKDQSPELVIVA